ncbi:MAG: thioredoxin-disulfide reductase [Paludibacteraceae bacterium]|nr:thioredoxin-disulfide reductase [Paludibacteraceae bacterium]
MERIKCLIIGSGPAGYTAGIYASRANLAPVMYEGLQVGGQLTTTTVIENYPGFPEGTDANELMEQFRSQAQRFGTEMRPGTVSAVDLSKRPFRITIDGKDELEAETLIVATGAAARYLGLEDEAKYRGRGVSVCATCDGFFFRKKKVAVVGGGDTACEEALYLSQLCEKVYMIVRKNYLRASDIMKKRVEERENIEILYEHNTTGLYGEQKLEGVHLVYRKGEPDESRRDLVIDGFFLAIGHTPNTSLFKDQLALDENGFILTEGKTTKTSVAGVFAAGDVADPQYQQAITAAASGCRAAVDAEQFLNNSSMV